jgi:hypothetical protein
MENEPMTGCTAIEELLLEGTPGALESAARHARDCQDCAETLAIWNEIGDTARSLQVQWQSDLLWPRIERSLRKEKRPARKFGRFAAAAMMTLALGATAFYAVREQSRTAAFDEHILRVSALDEVERAETAHRAAIQRLEKVAEARLEDDPSPLMISYKEKLMLLDDAIAECETAIERNRQNAHLRDQLLAMYSEKQQTLKDVLREDTHVSNR